MAASNGRTDEIAALFQRGLDPNTTDQNGTTLLGIATRAGDMKTVEMLLSYRASPNRRNAHGDTPILFAANQGRMDLVKRLHTAGADLEPQGWTVLHYGVLGGHVAVVQYALDQRVNINRRAPNHRTALMLAAQYGNLDLIKLLVAKGAATGMVDSNQQTAAQIASSKEFQSVAQYLASVPVTFEPETPKPDATSVTPAGSS